MLKTKIIAILSFLFSVNSISYAGDTNITQLIIEKKIDVNDGLQFLKLFKNKYLFNELYFFHINL